MLALLEPDLCFEAVRSTKSKAICFAIANVQLSTEPPVTQLSLSFPFLLPRKKPKEKKRSENYAHSFHTNGTAHPKQNQHLRYCVVKCHVPLPPQQRTVREEFGKGIET